LLLEHSWQFDRRVMHDGFKNKCAFVKDGKSITFVPLTLKTNWNWKKKVRTRVVKMSWALKREKKSDLPERERNNELAESGEKNKEKKTK
jgi:hypothetical protein